MNSPLAPTTGPASRASTPRRAAAARPASVPVASVARARTVSAPADTGPPRATDQPAACCQSLTAGRATPRSPCDGCYTTLAVYVWKRENYATRDTNRNSDTSPRRQRHQGKQQVILWRNHVRGQKAIIFTLAYCKILWRGAHLRDVTWYICIPWLLQISRSHWCPVTLCFIHFCRILERVASHVTDNLSDHVT